MEESENAATTDTRKPDAAPLIFISHDSRDAELATAFSELLTDVSLGVLKSFRSSDKTGTQGIEYGADWYPRIMSKLQLSSDVVCILTARSAARPWILFEAGVAKGHENITVHGLALGIPIDQASAGPFAQLQNCSDDVESMTSLIMQLASRISGSAPSRNAIKIQVAAFKEKIKPSLDSLNKEATKPERHQPEVPNRVAKLFEEVKVMFQDLTKRNESQELREVLTILRAIQSGNLKVHSVDVTPKRYYGHATGATEPPEGLVAVNLDWMTSIQEKRGRSVLHALVRDVRDDRPALAKVLLDCSQAIIDMGTLKLYFDPDTFSPVRERLLIESTPHLNAALKKIESTGDLRLEILKTPKV